MSSSFSRPSSLALSSAKLADVSRDVEVMDSNHDEKRRPSTTTTGMRIFRGRLCRGIKWLLALCALIFLWSTIYLVMPTARFTGLLPGNKISDESLSWSQLDKLNVPERDNHTSTTRRLRVFMAADKPNINLCKTIMSGVALGYPMPTLLNWHREYNRPNWHFGGSHIAKLESLLDAVEHLSASGSEDEVREDDLVLLVDAYDVWFQLPPSVLIQRFHQLNKEANERLQKEWADLGIDSDFPIKPPRQEIVISTAKDCFPDSNSGSNPYYEHWPESPMSKDLYGRDTDKVMWTLDSARKYKKIRPRCVNSGMIMGSMGALKHALRRSKEKVDVVSKLGRQLWSDQALIGEVMGEQEMWREWVKTLGASWDGEDTQHKPLTLDRDVRRIARAALTGQRFEFGIGLDYNFTTIPPTCSAEEDGSFVKIDETAKLEIASAKAGVLGPVRITDIPSELENFQDPDGLLSSTQWGKEPLYTDFYFGIVPVGIHHNAYTNGLKPKRLQDWWSKMWFYPQLRDVITRRLINPQSEMPLVKMTLGEEDVEYRAPKEDEEKKAVRVFSAAKRGEKFEAIGWNEVCQKPKSRTKWYDELFGDGIGPPAFEHTPI